MSYNLNLNKKNSKKYYCDKNYREKINSMDKKILLDFCGDDEIIDGSKLKCSSELKLTDCRKISDISTLTEVLILDLNNCKKIKDVGNLRKLKQLTISQKIEGIHLLKNLETLNVFIDDNNDGKKIESMVKKLNKNIKVNGEMKKYESKNICLSHNFKFDAQRLINKKD